MEQEPLQQAEEWAVNTFGAADLGDPRRTDRLILVASALAVNPSASLPHALESWGETQGSYRLLSDPAFRYEDVLLPHWSQVYDEAAQCRQTLLLADTTEFDARVGTRPEKREGTGGQQESGYRFQLAHGSGDESADPGDLGVHHSGTLYPQARTGWGNEGPTEKARARIAGLGAQYPANRTGP